SRWRILPIPATFSQPQLSATAPAASGPLPSALAPAGPALPLSLGFAAAVPVTVAQRRIRRRVTTRRRRR
ncbi:MAG: signal peptidase I, partial [Streptosporangiaceae bacterium]|nr:signal peptidase I [Streptosporangiaceae bacterium]